MAHEKFSASSYNLFAKSKYQPIMTYYIVFLMHPIKTHSISNFSHKAEKEQNRSLVLKYTYTSKTRAKTTENTRRIHAFYITSFRQVSFEGEKFEILPEQFIPVRRFARICELTLSYRRQQTRNFYETSSLAVNGDHDIVNFFLRDICISQFTALNLHGLELRC